MYAFILGREFKLSLAELIALLGSDRLQFACDAFAVFGSLSEEEARTAFLKSGGSIRLLRIEGTCTTANFPTKATEILRERAENHKGKFSFAFGAYWAKIEHFDLGFRLKKIFQKEGYSVRIVNQKNENINAASFKKERLSFSLGEICLLSSEGGTWITTTLLCQDVDLYSERDLAKGRDMVIGMLPPKLARMMVNLAGGGSQKWVYDPFCGLGTVLIEAADLGARSVNGSDINPAMVESTSNALSDYRARSDKDFQFETETLDARDIDRKRDSLVGRCIVTEGYLGEILGKHSVTPERIHEQKRELLSIYRDFFLGLASIGYSEKIVITFPFWDVKWKYYFFEEIQELIKKAGFRTDSLLPEGSPFTNTKYGTLLYRRHGQTVGREVTRLIRVPQTREISKTRDTSRNTIPRGRKI